MDVQAGQNSVVRGAIELGIMIPKANPIKFMWELEERHKGGTPISNLDGIIIKEELFKSILATIIGTELT